MVRLSLLTLESDSNVSASTIQPGTTIWHLGTEGSNPLAPTNQVGSLPSASAHARIDPAPGIRLDLTALPVRG